MAGTIGRLLIMVAFVACATSGFAYFKAARNQLENRTWIRVGRIGWFTMLIGVLAASGILSYLIFSHQFQYNYVWSHSSLDQQTRFLFSSFWGGQEGSFLLWIVLTALVGVGVLLRPLGYEAPVMTIIALCQAFMISMVVGIKLGPIPIGSSPFMLLAERFPDAPFLAAGGVPPDGQGLNDLLKNPWMVIHPPTLFIGFSLMIVPFAYAVAGLWKKKYLEWVRPALPWALFANMVLMGGIIMGGYWAYITLSFGGYWAWDPVENSSFVPWLVGIAAIHTMIAQKKSGTSQKAAIWLSILAYMLVIYSTFLTRSGILGDISVHSFVDLGLYNQLLLWILSIAVVGFGLFAYRYKELPRPRQEPNFLSREFMIFSGAMLLCALALVIILGTSTPILGRIFRDNPSGVPIEFYNKWSLPLSVGIAFLVGIGQLFWWNKMSVESINRVLIKPLTLAVASTIVFLLLTPFTAYTTQPATVAAATTGVSGIQEAGLAAGFATFWAQYGTSLLLLLLVFASFFAFYGNSIVLWRVGRGNPKMAGGAVTHVGFALMLLGMVTSSGMNNPLIGTNAGPRDNFIIQRGETQMVEGFQVQYVGQERNEEGHPTYILDFTDPQGRSFTMRPVVYKTTRDQWIQNPDLKTYFEKDIYVAVSPSVMYQDRAGESQAGEIMIKRDETRDLGNGAYTMRFLNFDVAEVQPTGGTNNAGLLKFQTFEYPLDSTLTDVEIAVAAILEVTNEQSGETRTLQPVYLVMKDRSQQFIQNRLGDWGLTITFAGMQVDTGEIRLLVEGVDVAAEDWLVVQAYEKPLINLLWYGSLIMLSGFLLAMYRRLQEQKLRERRVPA